MTTRTVPLPHAPQNDAAARAFEAVYKEHAEDVKRWALRLAGPWADVEDVVHEVFLVVRKRLDQFRGDAKLTTWLYRITERVVGKQLRRQRLRRWLSGHAGDFASHLPADEGTPHDELERQQASALVYEALDRLSDNHRKVIILYELEGLSGEEIATLIDVKLSTVWTWLHRARAKFFETLQAIAPTGSAPRRRAV
jgi:RNA polymerase sigma-70 factor (ECF subfamily)